MKKRLLALFLAVSLLASFLAVGAQALVAADFSDVPEDSWYYEDVDFVAKNDLMKGYPDGTFKPSKYLTREELMMILARMDNTNRDEADKYDLSKADSAPFADVAADRWSAPAIQWAKEKGITVGNNDDSSTFNPTGELTRQELATFVDRFVEYYLKSHPNVKLAPKYVVEEEFPDLETAAAWAQEHITDCRVDGLIYGFEDGLFHPYRVSTRAQIAAIIHRLCFELQIIPEPTPGEVKYYHTFTLTYHFVDEAGAELQAAQTVKNTVETSVKSVTFTVLDTTPLREGYTFKEWNTKADGTGTAYAPGAKLTTSTLANDLYSIWTRNVVPPAPVAKYTLTYNYNVAGTADETTDEQTSREFTVKAPTADKIPAGYSFLYWTTEQAGGGDKYYEGDTFTAPEGEPDTVTNSTLYAQWLADEDYIGNAVKATMAYLNGTIVANTEDDGELARERINVDVDELFFNGEIDPDDTRDQSMSASVDLDEDLLPGLIRFTAQTVVAILESTDGIKAEARDQANAIINEIAAEVEALTGIDLPEYTISAIKDDVTKVIEDTRKAAGTYVSGIRQDLGSIWKLDGKYIASECAIEVFDPDGNQVGTAVVAKAKSDGKEMTFDGGLAKAGATIGRYLVKALAKNLKTYTDEYVYEVELAATLKFTFTDSEALTAAEQHYPHVYPVELALTLDGGDLICYRYEDGGYLVFNVTEDAQEAYAEEIENVVDGALSNQRIMRTVNTELQKAVKQVMEYKAFVQVQKLFDNFGSSVNVAEKIAQWSVDNNFDDIIPKQNGEISKFKDSPLFKRFWGGEIEEQTVKGFTFTDLYYKNDAILEVLDELGAVAAQKTEETMVAYLNANFGTEGEFRENMYKSIMGFLTVQAYYDIKNANEGWFGLDVDLLNNDNYRPLMEYVLAVAADICHAKVGQGTPQLTAERVRAACKNVEDLIEEKMPGKEYLGKLTGLKDIKSFQKVSLGELAKLLNNGKLREQIGDAANGLLNPLQKLIKRMPSDASVSIVLDGGSKITFSKAALSAIRSASNTSELLDAVVAFMTSSPAVKALTLGDFEIGQEKLIEITKGGETHTFHLGVHFA